MPWLSEVSEHISEQRLRELVEQTVAEARKRLCARPKRVLLLPPDITRAHSGAGLLAEWLYQMLCEEAEVHLIPTLGQHVPHTAEENRRMFGSVPQQRIHAHDWRGGCVRLGEVPAEFVKQATGGAADWAIPVELNPMLVQQPWDWVVNIGHVVPHEVLGFANHNKNYFIGLAGKETICASHMAAACCGIENNLGSLITPVRACFNKAEEDFLGHLPDFYIQLVMARDEQGQLVHTGFFAGDDLETYLQAAQLSRRQNITVLDQPLHKVVCVMQGDEFFSTWVANKAIYRTRMAIADGGQLLVIAPGLKRFGEQPEVDELIRRYGYCGTAKVMEAYRCDPMLQQFAHAAAHLIHGSSEGRFLISYAQPNLSRQEIEAVGFGHADFQQTLSRYRLEQLKEGFNRTADGEQFYFIPTPSAGLWATREKLYNRPSGFAD